MIAPLAAVLALAPVRPDAIRVDAFFDDWEGRASLRLGEVVRGKADADQARIQLAWTAEHLLLAVQVVDDSYRAGDGESGDRFALAWEGHQLEILLRDLEDPPPLARLDGRSLPRARFHGTRRKDGWAFEAAIPLGDLPALVGAPVKLAAIIHDADTGREAESVRATAPLDDRLQPTAVTAHLSATAGLLDRFRADQSYTEPLRVLQGNLYGQEGMVEEVHITPQELVVLGHELPAGMGYAFATHGWRSGPTLVEVRLAELDGRPGQELFVIHREWAVPGETQVEVAEIWGMTADGLRCWFAQKVGEYAPGFGEATTQVEVVEGRPARLRVRPARVTGFNEGNYTAVDPPDMPFNPLPMPWQGSQAREFKLTPDGWR